MNKIRLGIIREGKVPHDRRVPFTPTQCKELLLGYPNLEIFIQPCPYRCFPDYEFADAGIPVTENLSGCDILMGIKEVPVADLLPGKTYLFFSHTIKKQPHNQKLLKTIIQKKIRLVDYECLTYPDGFRVLGFGRFAGIVGVHNALTGYGRRHRLFNLKPAHLCYDRNEMNEELKKLELSQSKSGFQSALQSIKIVITGEGRVAGGAKESLRVAGIRQVEPEEFLENTFNAPVYCQLGVTHYNRRKDGALPGETDFYKNPGEYESAFLPYAKASDIFISCHFWDPKAPKLFSVADMQNPQFKIKVIADVSCDINGSVPSTIRSTEIAHPFFGFNPVTGKEEDAFNKNCITVMAVDNLPCELPRDASADFGQQLIKDVMPHLLSSAPDPMIERATIAKNGTLTLKYSYLSDYVNT